MKSSNASIGRYARYLAGQTAEEIAEADQVSLKVVQKSLSQGAELENQRILVEVMNLKEKGALENEKFRQKVREGHSVAAYDAIGVLLKGETTVPQINKTTGEVTFKTFQDTRVLSVGVELFQKMASMIEKPAPNTVINNVQQNNTQNNNVEGGFDFESSITRIREQQRTGEPPIQDAEVITDESRLVGDGEDEDWSKF